MPRRNERVRLQDVLVAIGHIRTSMKGVDREALLDDREKLDSIILNFFRIGEAIYPLPDGLLNERPEVPWRKIRSLRNLLAHVYWGVDGLMLWDTAENDLPALEAAVQALLERLDAREEQEEAS